MKYLAIIIYALPLYLLALAIGFHVAYSSVYKMDMVHYFKNKPDIKNIDCFDNITTQTCFTWLDQAHKQYASAYPFFWWLYGVYSQEVLHGLSPKLALQKKFFIDNVAEHMARHKTDIILVGENDRVKYYMGKNFDMINYLSTEPSFKAVWQNYYFVTTIDGVKVYQRRKDHQAYYQIDNFPLLV